MVLSTSRARNLGGSARKCVKRALARNPTPPLLPPSALPPCLLRSNIFKTSNKSKKSCSTHTSAYMCSGTLALSLSTSCLPPARTNC